MTIAERSHVAGPLIAATEQDIGVWFADQAAQAPGHREDQLAALIDAMRDAIGANAAQDILARAGLTGSDEHPHGAILPRRACLGEVLLWRDITHEVL